MKKSPAGYFSVYRLVVHGYDATSSLPSCVPWLVHSESHAVNGSRPCQTHPSLWCASFREPALCALLSRRGGCHSYLWPLEVLLNLLSSRRPNDLRDVCSRRFLYGSNGSKLFQQCFLFLWSNTGDRIQL